MMKLFSQLSTDISIHALLAESDRCCPCAIIAPAISIHALLAESDAAIFFLYCAFPYFYPRSPCGERRFHFNAGQHICVISIHALLAESDLNFHHRRPCCFQFLSTLSLRRATSWATRARAAQLFLSTLSLRRATNSRHNFGPKNRFLSTLSLRRATSIKPIFGEINTNFYPRSPCGERPIAGRITSKGTKFLSTLSLRRATAADISIRREANISIHALLAESDHNTRNNCIDCCISIHALLAESDNRFVAGRQLPATFLSTLSLRRATKLSPSTHQ